jgi:hypothetical protein
MNNEYKDRGIFTGMDEDSYQKLKKAFNLPEQNQPKKTQLYDNDRQNKTRNNRRHKKSNNK